MKRLLFILITLFTSTALLVAQNASTFSIGPRAGINFSTLVNTDESTFNTGLAAGITATYSINEKTGLSFDALYSQEGNEEDGLTTNETLNLDYIRLMLTYDVFFGELGQRFRPKLYVGPQIGFLTKAEAEILDQNEDISDNFKDTDFGLVAGLGFNYQIGGKQWLNVDARFQPGLTDIVENKPAGEDAIRNRTIQVSIGIAFGLY